jgi:[ribosomal protein S18]-alanine N-acetyltransferase
MPNSTLCPNTDIVRLRRATSADIPQMRQLEQQVATAAHWSAAQYEALFSPDAALRLALIASADTSETTILGFLIARCLPDEWEIENVVVAAESRHRGVGSALVCELLAEARTSGAKAIGLEVRESNLHAMQLYEKLGFKQDGRRAGYYQNPTEYAILYRFSLQSCDKIS